MACVLLNIFFAGAFVTSLYTDGCPNSHNVRSESQVPFLRRSLHISSETYDVFEHCLRGLQISGQIWKRHQRLYIRWRFIDIAEHEIFRVEVSGRAMLLLGNVC
jgi:hypothetical protein